AVRDIEAAIAYYESVGIGPWHDYPPLEEFTTLEVPDPDGFRRLDYRYAWIGDFQLQLVQPGPATTAAGSPTTTRPTGPAWCSRSARARRRDGGGREHLAGRARPRARRGRRGGRGVGAGQAARAGRRGPGRALRGGAHAHPRGGVRRLGGRLPRRRRDAARAHAVLRPRQLAERDRVAGRPLRARVPADPVDARGLGRAKPGPDGPWPHGRPDARAARHPGVPPGPAGRSRDAGP